MSYDPGCSASRITPSYGAIETTFSDMDIQRHVNNVAIARFFEEEWYALHYALRRLYRGEFRQIVLAGFEVHYLRAVSYPGPAEVAVGASQSSASAFGSVAAMFQDGQCVALSWERTSAATRSAPRASR